MIGYYVHHQGLGHLQRALSISRHLAEPPTLLSSLVGPDEGGAAIRSERASLPALGRLALPGPDTVHRWVGLPMDNESSPEDHTAHGTLHWVPRHDRGLRRRMAIIASWIDAVEPELMVVDVSVEVAMLCRLMGVPTIVMAMPGDRSDRAHRTAYDSAHAILAPWTAEFSASMWSDRWAGKTFHAGAISRYGEMPPPQCLQHDPIRVLVLWGSGGDGRPIEQVEAASRATPGTQWRIAGVGADARVPVWDLLCWADVVVTHGGQNAVAEVAAARRPAIVIAQDRPHGEQQATARTLEAAGLAVALRSFPDPARWSELLAAARVIGGRQWARWAPPDAAARAAGFLDRTARNVRHLADEPVA